MSFKVGLTVCYCYIELSFKVGLTVCYCYIEMSFKVGLTVCYCYIEMSFKVGLTVCYCYLELSFKVGLNVCYFYLRILVSKTIYHVVSFSGFSILISASVFSNVYPFQMMFVMSTSKTRRVSLVQQKLITIP